MTNCFFKYVKNLLKLHRQISFKKGDGKVADALRGQMDWQWKEMTKKEIAVVKKISVLLYELEDTEPAKE